MITATTINTTARRLRGRTSIGVPQMGEFLGEFAANTHILTRPFVEITMLHSLAILIVYPTAGPKKSISTWSHFAAAVLCSFREGPRRDRAAREAGMK